MPLRWPRRIRDREGERRTEIALTLSSAAAVFPSGAPPPAAPEWVGCHGCGAVQGIERACPGANAHCRICGTQLERARATDLRLALALSATTLILLVPAVLLPVYRVGLLAASRESHVGSGVRVLWREGFPLIALAVLLAVVILPLVRFSLLTLVLGHLRSTRRPPWLGRAYRVADTLTIWAMPDVLLLGIWVAYGRLHALFALEFEAGGVCLAAAALAAFTTRAAIDRRAVWRAIAAPPPLPAGRSLIACDACDLLVEAERQGEPCPRCAARLVSRRTDSVARTTALVAAGLLLYLPANFLPMAATSQLGDFLPYTVIQGVFDLAKAHLWGLAVLVFCASFAIPLLKLAGLGWCLHSVRTRSRRHLVAKTRLFGIIHEIGRWSMVDILAIATFVPLMQFGQLAGAEAMPGATAFLLVVLVTMLATHSFDTRLMWDAAEVRA